MVRDADDPGSAKRETRHAAIEIVADSASVELAPFFALFLAECARLLPSRAERFRRAQAPSIHSGCRRSVPLSRNYAGIRSVLALPVRRFS